LRIQADGREFYYAFSACKSLRKVNLPSNLEAICGQAFSGCGELVELVIPASLTNIKFLDQFSDDEEPDNYAFAGCAKIAYPYSPEITGIRL
jgi:uncharacterized ParB-like nuclease family protein